MHFKRIIVLAFSVALVVFSSCSKHETTIVQGTVRDSITLEPINSSEVSLQKLTIVWAGGGTTVKETVTDVDGNFHLQETGKKKSLYVFVSSKGYYPKSIGEAEDEYSIEWGKTNSLDILMQPLPTTLKVVFDGNIQSVDSLSLSLFNGSKHYLDNKIFLPDGKLSIILPVDGGQYIHINWSKFSNNSVQNYVDSVYCKDKDHTSHLIDF